MSQTVTVVYTIPAPAATGTFADADIQPYFANLIPEIQSHLSPSFTDGNPIVLTSVTCS